MPKKKGKGKAKVRKDIDWAADANYDRNRSMVYIEHTNECPIFGMKADEFGRWLQDQVPERIIQVVRNQNGKVHARPGSFEIGFSQTARTSVHQLWSGLEKGPPRRDKFPDFSSLLPEIRLVLKKFYPEVEIKVEEDFADDDYSANPPAVPDAVVENETTE